MIEKQIKMSNLLSLSSSQDSTGSSLAMLVFGDSFDPQTKRLDSQRSDKRILQKGKGKDSSYSYGITLEGFLGKVGREKEDCQRKARPLSKEDWLEKQHPLTESNVISNAVSLSREKRKRCGKYAKWGSGASPIKWL